MPAGNRVWPTLPRRFGVPVTSAASKGGFDVAARLAFALCVPITLSPPLTWSLSAGRGP